MENHTIVTLKKGEGRTIKAGGAWILHNHRDLYERRYCCGTRF